MSLHVIVITGNIGSGKTTTLRQIETWVEQRSLHDSVTVLLEDVSAWSYYLRKFYETYTDGNVSQCIPFGFLLQVQVLTHYHQVTKQLHELTDRCAAQNRDHWVFVERSPYDGKEVFIDINKSVYSTAQYHLLSGLFREYMQLDLWKNAIFVQIVTPVEECFRRIERRHREGENRITRQYLTQLHEAYADMAYRIDMKTLSLGGGEAPSEVAQAILRLCAVDGLGVV